MTPELRLAQLGLKLPAPPQPAGSYAPTVLAGTLLFLSGQFPYADGKFRYSGRVGEQLTPDEGRAAAQLAALNVLAQIHAALGGFDRLVSLARVEGHVACAPGFLEVPRVLDGASDLFNQVLGERGVHTRTAFAPAHLPRDGTIELVVTAIVCPA